MYHNFLELCIDELGCDNNLVNCLLNIHKKTHYSAMRYVSWVLSLIYILSESLL